jgi:hypothetical protein
VEKYGNPPCKEAQKTSFFMFVQEVTAVNTWQQLLLLRRLTTSFILSMVECVLTQGKHCVAHSDNSLYIHHWKKASRGIHM